MMLPPAADTPISSTQAFREAIAEAELGSVITVAADVTLELESLDLGDCDLTIRGGEPRPVLRLICDESAQRQSLFRVAGFLQLEDLSPQLVHESNPANSSAETDDGDAVRCLIDLDGGSLVLSGWRLGAEGDSACLQAGGGSQLELLDCQLHAPQGCVIDWKPAAGGEATAVSTIFSGRTAWAITDPVDASLVLERITAIVDRLAEIRTGLPADGLSLSSAVGHVGPPAAARQNAAYPRAVVFFLLRRRPRPSLPFPGLRPLAAGTAQSLLMSITGSSSSDVPSAALSMWGRETVAMGKILDAEHISPPSHSKPAAGSASICDGRPPTTWRAPRARQRHRASS